MIAEFIDPMFLRDRLNQLDVALSTRLSETVFTGRWDGGIYGFDGTTPRKIKTDANGRLEIGVVSTVNPSNLDVALSTRASETTLSGIKTQTDKLTFDAANRLAVQNPPNLDVALSTRASETTLSGIKTQTDKLSFDAANRLAIQNPPNLDVALSTRLADSKIPNALGQVSLDVVGTTMHALAVVQANLPSRMPYCVANISVTTTESSTSIASPGAKILVIRNRGDIDVLIGLNGSVPTTNPLILRARTVKAINHRSVTSVYYKTASGSSTIDIEYYN